MISFWDTFKAQRKNLGEEDITIAYSERYCSIQYRNSIRDLMTTIFKPDAEEFYFIRADESFNKSVGKLFLIIKEQGKVFAVMNEEVYNTLPKAFKQIVEMYKNHRDKILVEKSEKSRSTETTEKPVHSSKKSKDANKEYPDAVK